MRKHIFAAALIAGTAIALPASAQYSGTVGVAAGGRHHRRGQLPVFRRYVVEERLPSYAIPDRVVVGARCLKRVSSITTCPSVSAGRPIATRS